MSKKSEKLFEVISICREDLYNFIGEEKANNISDTKMQELASSVSDYYDKDCINYLEKLLKI